MREAWVGLPNGRSWHEVASPTIVGRSRSRIGKRPQAELVGENDVPTKLFWPLTGALSARGGSLGVQPAHSGIAVRPNLGRQTGRQLRFARLPDKKFATSVNKKGVVCRLRMRRAVNDAIYGT